MAGCASPGHNPKDPFESVNRGVYKFNDTVDKAVIKPVAKGYNAILPEPGKIMLSNFFSNLNDVVVTVNDLLQLKVFVAISDTGRIAVNTTVGFGGLFDVATAVGLEKHYEDFGQTLGKWGVGSGPYLILPLLGPSTVRDGVGLYADSYTSVINRVENIPTRNELYATSLLGRRARLLKQEEALDEASLDRYAFIRDAYLQQRQNLIYDGNPPRQKYDDEDELENRSSIDPKEGAEQSSAPQLPVVRRIWVSRNTGMN
jgi:phospholipid-binding lipoprotein MlaA